MLKPGVLGLIPGDCLLSPHNTSISNVLDILNEKTTQHLTPYDKENFPVNEVLTTCKEEGCELMEYK